jgi:hypothetical protein
MSKRCGSPLPLTITCVLVLWLALAGGALAACGEDSAPADDGGSQSPFAGLWEPVEASFDITWDEGSRSYSLSSGGSGGGLEVVGADAALTVTLVGKSGARSDALPATESGEALNFAIPTRSPTTRRPHRAVASRSSSAAPERRRPSRACWPPTPTSPSSACRSRRATSEVWIRC